MSVFQGLVLFTRNFSPPSPPFPSLWMWMWIWLWLWFWYRSCVCPNDLSGVFDLFFKRRWGFYLSNFSWNLILSVRAIGDKGLFLIFYLETDKSLIETGFGFWLPIGGALYLICYFIFVSVTLSVLGMFILITSEFSSIFLAFFRDTLEVELLLLLS